MEVLLWELLPGMSHEGPCSLFQTLELVYQDVKFIYCRLTMSVYRIVHAGQSCV